MTTLENILQSAKISTNNLNHITISRHDPILPSPFKIGEAGAAALAAVGHVSAKLWYEKTKQQQDISITVKDAAIFQRSHEYLKLLDQPTPDLWSPISGFYQTKDNKFVQFHCNFPHHREGVIKLLNCEDNKESVIEATKTWHAEDLETKLSNLGMCCTMIRSPQEWEVHEQHLATQNLPLLEIIKLDNSPIKPLSKQNDRPLSGVNVLDLTRVIAGPICGRTLAEHGANTLLISSPNLPSLPVSIMDTGHGKLSAYLDLNQSQDMNTMDKLLSQTDIFVQSYRPGGLDKKGLSPELLAEKYPGIIYVSFSAYSHLGPWASRHGYDSLVQSATGIAYTQGGNISSPKHLPAQSLDYITGLLGAMGAMEALYRRSQDGGSYLVRVSLLQTANWFKNLGFVKGYEGLNLPLSDDIKDMLDQANTQFGHLEYLKPVLKMSQTPPYWDKLAVPLGTHKASFNN